jgi:hypothetical protein
MAILYGTTADGESLPVQVNEFGQLVAQGLEGAQGPQGEQGLQGEPGPAGEPGTVIRSIQHVQASIDSGLGTALVNIVPVDEAKSFVQYNGQTISYASTSQKEWNNDVALYLVGSSRVEILRQVSAGSAVVYFSVIEYA